MGYKMNGPSLYKPKMANMDIEKDYAKKSDDRAMSSPYQKNEGKKPHSMAGQVNAKGNKIVGNDGNWRPLTDKDRIAIKNKKNNPPKKNKG